MFIAWHVSPILQVRRFPNMSRSMRKSSRPAEPNDMLSSMSRNHGGKILRGLSQLHSDSVLCDYTLVADSLRISVHCVVMVACSDYFRAILTGDMMESRADHVVLGGITGVGLRAITGIGLRCITGVGLCAITGVGLRAITGVGLRAITGVGLRAITGVGLRAIVDFAYSGGLQQDKMFLIPILYLSNFSFI